MSTINRNLIIPFLIPFLIILFGYFYFFTNKKSSNFIEFKPKDFNKKMSDKNSVLLPRNVIPYKYK